MDIHKPKPIHNMRDFLKEVGIIVLGVCIALAAEQAVEWLHWRGRIAQTRIVLGNELGTLQGFGIERVRIESCIERRLDEIAAVLDQASRTGSLPPMPQMEAPISRIWNEEVWQTTVASDTATHFAPAELNAIANVYSQARTVRELNLQESAAWASLNAIVGPGRKLDPASEAKLRDALSLARWYNRIMAVAGGQMARRASSLNMPYNGAIHSFIDTALNLNKTSEFCHPLNGKPPATYGQAQGTRLRPILRDWQKYPPYVAAPSNNPP